MPLLTHPSRPKPPRFNKKRQIPRQDSQTTLGEEEERYDDQDQMEYHNYVRRSTTTGDRSSITQRTNHRSWRSIPTPISSSSSVWPAPGSPPLIVANFSPSPSPPPILVKRSTTRVPQPPRPKLWTTASAAAMLPPLTVTTAQERAGPRIIQAQLPSRISPDPKKHVFIGPWLNRRGDEWVGITSFPGQYRFKAAKEDKAFDPKFLNYPEEIHHFMNPIGDVMDARTLGMVSKAARL